MNFSSNITPSTSLLRDIEFRSHVCLIELLLKWKHVLQLSTVEVSRKSGKTSIVTYKLLLTGTCSLKVDEHTWNPFGVRNNTLIAYLLKKHVKCGCSRNRQLLAFISFLKSVYVYEIEPHGKILRQKKMTTETRTHLQFSIPWTSAQWKSHCY